MPTVATSAELDKPMQTKIQDVFGSASPRPTTKTPNIHRLGLIASIVTWLTMSRELTQLAKRIAGDSHYNDHRHAIKNEILRRVSAVINGFDRRSQTLLFKCNLMDDVVPRAAGHIAKGVR